MLEGLAFAVSHLTGELRFLGDRVTLEAKASAGDGTLAATGGMTLGPALLGPAEVTLQAERVPLAYPEGFRGRASGTIHLKGDPDSAYVISGDIGLRQGYYTAEFDASAQSLGRLDWQLAALRGGSDRRDAAARRERPPRGAAPHPQQPGEAGRGGLAERVRHPRPADRHRPGDAARGRDAHASAGPTCAWPRARWS